MPKFSESSKKRLATCDKRLQNLFNEVIVFADCSIICGHRGEEEQNKAFKEGRSKIEFPFGKHNSLPSQAVDVYPYPFNWDEPDSYENIVKCYWFGGVVKAIAWELGILIRWGGDWDSDNDLFDQDFNDLPHFELKT